MSKAKQLECELKCKATGGLNQSVAEDFKKKDRNLQDLLNDEDEKQEHKDNAISGS